MQRFPNFGLGPKMGRRPIFIGAEPLGRIECKEMLICEFIEFKIKKGKLFYFIIIF